MEFQLELCMEPDIRFFLHHALPLSILQPVSKNFLFSNYIQLYKSTNNNYLFDIYPRLGCNDSFSENILDAVMENHTISGDIFPANKIELFDMICEWLNNGFYVQMMCDETKIPGTQLYGCEEFHCHQALFYGYNKDTKKLKMINYDTNKRFGTIDIHRDVLERIFLSKRMTEHLARDGKRIKYKDYVIELMRPKHDVIKYNYSFEATLTNITTFTKEYLKGTDSAAKEILKYKKYEDSKWGINVYQYLYEFLIGEYRSYYGFQCICGLLEHKLLMKKRINFLKGNGIDIPEKLFERMDNIIQMCSLIKSVYFKAEICKEWGELAHCANLVDKIRIEEEIVLEELVRKIIVGV